jgi:hypothetical protein
MDDDPKQDEQKEEPGQGYAEGATSEDIDDEDIPLESLPL